MKGMNYKITIQINEIMLIVHGGNGPILQHKHIKTQFKCCI